MRPELNFFLLPRLDHLQRLVGEIHARRPHAARTRHLRLFVLDRRCESRLDEHQIRIGRQREARDGRLRLRVHRFLRGLRHRRLRRRCRHGDRLFRNVLDAWRSYVFQARRGDVLDARRGRVLQRLAMRLDHIDRFTRFGRRCGESLCRRRNGVLWRGFPFFTAVCGALATLATLATLAAATTASAPPAAAAFAMLFAAVPACGPRHLRCG